MIDFSVNSSARLEATPELAIVTVDTRIERINKKLSYERVVKQHNWLVSEAKKLQEAGDVASYVANAPRAYSYQRYNADNSALKTFYSTSASVVLIFTDFSSLGEWLGTLALQSEASYSFSVAWKLTKETREKLERETRREAIAQARRIATDYAVGDNIDTVKHPLKLKAVEDSPSGRYAGPMLRGAAAMSTPTVELQPGLIKIESEVRVSFELEL